jgi:hypothetical protein
VTVTHGLGITPESSQVQAWALSDLGAGESFYIDNITSTTFRINLVQAEVNNGSSSVPNGATTVNVTHGMSRTPNRWEIRINASAAVTNDPGNMWIDNIGATTFRVNWRNDPGASGAAFDWAVKFDTVKEASNPGKTVNFGWNVNAGSQRTSEASNPVLEADIGRAIRRKVNVGAMSLAAAERIRDRLLIALGRPRYAARVRVEGEARLTGPHGELGARETARAGEWFQLADLPLLLVVATSYDVTGNRLDLTLGDAYPTLREQVARLERAEARRGRGIDPASGGSLA